MHLAGMPCRKYNTFGNLGNSNIWKVSTFPTLYYYWTTRVGAFPLLYYLKFGEIFDKNTQPVHFGSAQLSISIKYGDILV